jgi:PAS domain S-box-containing protein
VGVDEAQRRRQLEVASPEQAYMGRGSFAKNRMLIIADGSLTDPIQELIEAERFGDGIAMKTNNLALQVKSARTRFENLCDRADEPSFNRAELLAEAIEELSHSFEELSVITEELHHQNEELIAARGLLEAEREQYLDLFEFAPDGYIVTDIAGTIQRANRAGAKLLHVRQDFIVGKPLIVFISEQEHKIFSERLNELQHREAQTLEIELVPRDGAPFPAVVTVSTIRETAGAGARAVGYRWLIRDITERKQAEEALQESEERFRLMVEGVKDYAIFTLDTEGRVTSWNDGAERIKGYREEEILGEDFARFYPPEDAAEGKPKEQLRLAAARGGMEDEGWRVRKDGTRFWAEVLLTALRNEEGTPIGFCKLTRDITGRVRAEEALRRSEAYLAEAQRLSHTGSWAWNVSSGELFWSLEHFRIFGLDPEKAKPSYETFFEMVHPEDRPSVMQGLEQAVRERSDFESNYRIVCPAGSIKHIHSLAHPVFNESGDITEYVGTVIDMTEQQQARAALEQAFEEIKNLKDRLHHENIALREEIDRTGMFEEIVGSSPALKTVLARVAKVASTDSTILITGETGTGKELIARAIHKRSKRADRPFVAVNCAGIPPSLIASELFGHEKGSFTGAQQRRLGRFELAEGGTIFLDEVGEFLAETQITLLRVIQEHEFERVGGSQPISADVRIIAATNRNLEDAIAAGTFRLDLFYRLNVFPIEVPPLRERKQDIPLLLDYFIKRHASEAGKNIQKIDKETVELFKSYLWPGNIRELQSVIERSVILCESEIFSVDPSWLSATPVQPHRSSSGLAERLRDEERKIIESALSESQGRIAGRSGAAAKLGIPSSTLESKIKMLKIKKYRFKSD